MQQLEQEEFKKEPTGFGGTYHFLDVLDNRGRKEIIKLPLLDVSFAGQMNFCNRLSKCISRFPDTPGIQQIAWDGTFVGHIISPQKLK